MHHGSRLYWTKERCSVEAKKHIRKKDFRIACGGAYSRAEKKGFLNEICSHMFQRQKHPPNYWNRGKCLEESKKYKHMKPFQKGCPAAYDAAFRNGWLPSISEHMEPQGNRMKRMIYVFLFKDKSCYVGLTCNFENRFANHLAGRGKTLFLRLNSEKYPYRVTKTPYQYTPEEAQEEEKRKIQYYSSRGYRTLNVAKAGGLGGSEKIWTKENCRKIALQHKTRKSLRESCYIAYDRIVKSGWGKELFSHMTYLHRPYKKDQKKNAK